MRRSIAVAGLWIALAGSFLVFCPILLRPYSLPKTLILSAGLLLSWLGIARLRRTRLDGPMAALALVAVLCAAFPVDPPRSVFGDYHQPYYGLLELALYGLCFYLGASVDSEQRKTGSRALCAAGALMGLACAAQALGLVAPPWDSIGGRMLSTTGNPVMAGMCLAVLLPLALRPALAGSGWGWAAAFAVGTGLVLTRSLGAMLGAGAGLGMHLWLSGRLPPGRWRRWAVVGVALAGVAVAWKLGTGRSNVMRIELWRAAVSAAAERPVLGYGPDTYMLALRRHRTPRFVAAAGATKTVQSSAHNDLLQVLATMGLSGLAVYLWLWGAFAVLLRRSRPLDEGSAAAAGALAAAFVAAKFAPAPTELVAACAWLGGILAVRNPEVLPGKKPPRASAIGEAGSWPMVLAGACLLLTAVFASLCAANVMALRAKMASGRGQPRQAGDLLAKAAALAPFELKYVALRCSTAAQAAAPRERATVGKTLLGWAAQGARLHPGDPAAHEIYGTAAFFASDLKDKGLLRLAMDELRRASRLDPHHLYPIRRRIEIAHVLGDREAQREASADDRRVRAIADTERPSEDLP